MSMLFCAEVDVQIGNGRLNYINKYVANDHDAVDVGLGEYVQKGAHSAWLSTYRLLSKGSPCIPEVAIRMAQLSEFERSYTHVLLYPPQPAAMVSLEGRQTSFSSRMYGFYLQEKRQTAASGTPVSDSFLSWHRSREYDSDAQAVKFRGGMHQQRSWRTPVVACRYWYELTDGFWGQFCVTQLPHQYAADLLPSEHQHLESMQNFVGMLEYLGTWRWGSEAGVVTTTRGFMFSISALPFLVDADGRSRRWGSMLLVSVCSHRISMLVCVWFPWRSAICSIAACGTSA